MLLKIIENKDGAQLFYNMIIKQVLPCFSNMIIAMKNALDSF